MKARLTKWQRVHVGMWVALAALDVVWAATANEVWPGAIAWSALVAVNVFLAIDQRNKYRRKNHGSDRRTEADPQDPAPEGSAGTGASPLSFTLNTSSSAGLTYAAIQKQIQALSTVRTSLGPPSHMEAVRKRLDVETVESDLPILAHRIARLRLDGTSKPFSSLNEGIRFGVDADASCSSAIYRIMRAGSFNPPTSHDAPAIGCTCGFYALPSDVEPWGEGTDYVTLMVELSGSVIEHDKGYRAQHQRVVECQIPACPYCGAAADVLAMKDGQMRATYCAKHAHHNDDNVYVAVDDARKVIPVTVVCRSGSPAVEGHP